MRPPILTSQTPPSFRGEGGTELDPGTNLTGRAGAQTLPWPSARAARPVFLSYRPFLVPGAWPRAGSPSEKIQFSRY